MAGDHIRAEIFYRVGQDHRMKENGRLGNIGLFKLFIGSLEHDPGNIKSQYRIRLVKKLFCAG
ncbi:hypothetical protein D9M68_897690 [compost metagenome]